jgi:hypothetical protein
MAIPQRMQSPRPQQPPLRIVRMSGDALKEGVVEMTLDSVSIPVFNPAKTVADCFKFRNKIGVDVAIEALKESWNMNKVTMDELWHYATVNRVANVMRPYLESVAG